MLLHFCEWSKMLTMTTGMCLRMMWREMMKVYQSEPIALHSETKLARADHPGHSDKTHTATAELRSRWKRGDKVETTGSALLLMSDQDFCGGCLSAGRGRPDSRSIGPSVTSEEEDDAFSTWPLGGEVGGEGAREMGNRRRK